MEVKRELTPEIGDGDGPKGNREGVPDSEFPSVRTTVKTEEDNTIASITSPAKKKRKPLGPGSVLSRSLQERGIRGPASHPSTIPTLPNTTTDTSPVPDHLAHHLRVLFIGFNPGVQSARRRCHYGNPGNHFWKCVVGSGLTGGVGVTCDDDKLCPRLYGLGFTNIISRSSPSVATLQKSEYSAGVPPIVAKLVTHRPRVVCFVGVKVFEAFWEGVQGACRETEADGSAINRRPLPASRKFQLGLQPKSIHYAPRRRPTPVDGPAERDTDSKDETTIKEEEETLLFVMPSTSGRVVHYTRADKLAFFVRLREVADRAVRAGGAA
ncbi:uracil-DNA glycosylase-like protein [Fimicolochytrium jonesii]|uniref:uracil-DNA glycosylase-like protein n=1 Tax=Fimicolochytrium jonesii TaxID=1396493 RepID=UPI0022FF249D|nr:uracil-DNA glycosylase-like protein [Fimicolochytrium jonesii]KAI8821157.1 uracil-DNA glycosylase-like protein [Fimicolochytrium jonesii]